MIDIFGELQRAARSGESFALALLAGIKGSSPQKKGAKALFYPDGRIVGTLGGGCLEAEVQQRARHALLTQTPEVFDLVLDHDFGWDDGLICGGKVSGVILPQAAQAGPLWVDLAERRQALTWGVKQDFTIGLVDQPAEDWIYSETVAPACALWIAGAGHIAQAVTPLAQRLDFTVTVFDDRAALANSRYFPTGTQFRVDYWEKLLAESLPARPTFGLIVTRGHQHDALALKHWVRQPFVFLGMIGSRRKKRLIFDGLVAEEFATEQELSKVACPVGLEILSQSVEEIALSIMAQFVAERGAKVFGRVPKAGERPGAPLCAGALDPRLRPEF